PLHPVRRQRACQPPAARQPLRIGDGLRAVPNRDPVRIHLRAAFEEAPRRKRDEIRRVAIEIAIERRDRARRTCHESLSRRRDALIDSPIASAGIRRTLASRPVAHRALKLAIGLTLLDRGALVELLLALG